MNRKTVDFPKGVRGFLLLGRLGWVRVAKRIVSM